MSVSEHAKPDEMTPPPALRAMVQQDADSLAARRRRRAAICAVVTLGILAAFTRFSELAALTPTTMAGTVAFAVVGFALFAFAFGLSLPAGRRLKPVAGLSFLAGLGLLSLFVEPDSTHGAGEVFWSAGMGCLQGGALISAAVLVGALVMGRGLLRRHAPTGLLLGLGAGLLGLVPVHLHCTADAAAHVMVWHALIPVVASALAGLLWGALGRSSED